MLIFGAERKRHWSNFRIRPQICMPIARASSDELSGPMDGGVMRREWPLRVSPAANARSCRRFLGRMRHRTGESDELTIKAGDELREGSLIVLSHRSEHPRGLESGDSGSRIHAS